MDMDTNTRQQIAEAADLIEQYLDCRCLPGEYLEPALDKLRGVLAKGSPALVVHPSAGQSQPQLPTTTTAEGTP